MASILITGCSSGIGQALAFELLQRGRQVVATARNVAALDALKNAGARCYALDVTSADSLAALKQSLADDGVVIEMLVNNAGYGAMGPLLEMSDDQLKHQFDANVFALLAVTRALVPQMIEQGGGRVVNVGSVSGILTTPFSGAYCATKAAVHALSDALRIELKPFAIDVLVIQPGAIQSSFGATASAGVAQRQDQLGIYAPVADAIAARANASQQNATPTQDFARQMADVILAKKPIAFTRIGHGSTLLPLIQRLLPVAIRDHILAKRFGLDKPF
jgi:short-subunit dehydrogenase